MALFMLLISLQSCTGPWDGEMMSQLALNNESKLYGITGQDP